MNHVVIKICEHVLNLTSTETMMGAGRGGGGGGERDYIDIVTLSPQE